ncbi:MAG: hypothetical protein JWP57_1139 [Spirosoma sp.]|nr:hypothetical protein [Spirosoma sp.]
MQRLITVLTCSLVLLTFNSKGQTIESTGSISRTMAKKTASITPATYQGRQIIAGSGGGFTGFSTTYYLLDNRQLFGKRSRDTLFTPLGKQTAATTKRLFYLVEKTGSIKTTRFNNPGNMYKFVGWQKGKQTYQVTWGAAGTTVPAMYPKIYDSFMVLIPTTSRLN